MVEVAENREKMRSFWDLVASKVLTTHSSIQIARQNIVRWLAQGQSPPHRLLEWDKLLAAAEAGDSTQLLHALTSQDETSRRLRDFHPFAGILTREERRQAKELCGYRH